MLIRVRDETEALDFCKCAVDEMKASAPRQSIRHILTVVHQGDAIIGQNRAGH